jgi:hypothetical protein
MGHLGGAVEVEALHLLLQQAVRIGDPRMLAQMLQP